MVCIFWQDGIDWKAVEAGIETSHDKEEDSILFSMASQNDRFHKIAVYQPAVLIGLSMHNRPRWKYEFTDP